MRIRLDVEITKEEAQALGAFETIARRFDPDSPIHVAGEVLGFRVKVESDAPLGETFHEQARAAKRAVVQQAISENHGNISAAARALGTTRATVYAALATK